MAGMQFPNKVTIHCSDSPNGKPYDIEQIRKDHIARGFRDVGYHLVIQPNGEVQRGRGLNEIGAHVVNHNLNNIGVCLIGSDLYTMRQFESLRYYLHAFEQSYDIKPWNFYCHYEFDSAEKQGKTCPNIRSVDLVSWYILESYKPLEKYILRDKVI